MIEDIDKNKIIENELDDICEECKNIDKSVTENLMLTGYRVHGRIKTSQGGHQLTNTLLREFLSNKSNWELVDYQGQEKDHKGNSYNRLIAVNA